MKEIENMHEIRRMDKAITDQNEMKNIIQQTKYITIAMCLNNEPYLITLSHGYNPEKNIIYFHCASKGKKIDILKENNIVWGQALIDKGYVEDKCDHLWATVMFRGVVSFIVDVDEKHHALEVMIKQLEQNPQLVIKKQITKKSLNRVRIGRIDIDYMSGKKTDKTMISP
ncbi:MAG: pyridoxamine 5'-phosphate oxidase family protein [Euryarchaeota archaeon]|jgi:nitroimidazol reductase NimA-like FMN-containing flavoprotein (pyridoxamine 5'-phosphate oxidase superfamily)|nr:pyridoxamine 5'-phosphate oxidase family protein [Euryarchaeota archaeon]